MAKVTNPLLSVDASGQFAKAMVFQKGGKVRKYVVPANPQTVGQMAVRDRLKEIQKELKLLGAVCRAELKTGFGARWNSMIVGELMADNHSALDAYLAEFNAFGSTDKTAWAGADTVNPTVIDDGGLLYACASAVYDMAVRLGVTVSLTLPAAANSSTVAGEWTAAT
jgi:hypothetical protein